MPRPKRPQQYYDQIKDKFREERNLRLGYRPPGTNQYTSEFSGDLAKYAVDPYARKMFQKESLLAMRSRSCLSVGGSPPC